MSHEHHALEATELPADFADALRGMTADGTPPETLADAVDAFDRLWKSAGVTVSVDQMYQATPTRHSIDFGDRVVHVPCVLDALIAALAVGSTPVDIRSREPDRDETIRLSVTDDGIAVDPTTTVFSFGVAGGDAQDPDLSALEGTDSAVMASCSYINAFRDESAFEQWQAQLSDAYAMQIDLETFATFADVAVGDWVTVDGA